MKVLHTFIALVCVGLLCAANIKAQPTITFSPRSGTTLTRADVDTTLALHGLTRNSEFHAVIVGATVMADGTFITSGTTTTVSNGVFQQTRNLLSVSSSTVLKIGIGAFTQCDRLATVSIPNATWIDIGAFMNCSTLVNVDFPNVTAAIGLMSFFACTRLVSINFPNVASLIGNGAFNHCSSLVSINFPKVEEIGEYAFSWCINLVSVHFPNVTAIGTYAFRNCSSLVNIEIPNATYLGFPQSIEVFKNCVSLESIDLPKVEYIGQGVFANCHSLASVNFPSVKHISNEAFEYCTSLTEITFPAELLYISTGAFRHCSNLILITSFATTPPDLSDANGDNVFLGVHPDCIVCVIEDTVVVAEYITSKWNLYFEGKISDCTENIHEIIKKNTINIYPNPTKESTTLSFDLEKSCNVRISLIDIAGSELFEVYNGFVNTGQFIQTINTKNLLKGVYLLNIFIDNNSIVEKIVVE